VASTTISSELLLSAAMESWPEDDFAGEDTPESEWHMARVQEIQLQRDVSKLTNPLVEVNHMAM
jgi:hypothetical protein